MVESPAATASFAAVPMVLAKPSKISLTASTLLAVTVPPYGLDRVIVSLFVAVMTADTGTTLRFRLEPAATTLGSPVSATAS